MEKQAKTGLLFVCDVEGWYSRKPFSAITMELGGCNAMDPTTGTYTANILYTNRTREDLIAEIEKKIPGVMPYTGKWFHNAWTKAYGQGNTLAKGLTQSTIKEELKDQFGLGDTDVIIYWGSTAIDAEDLAKIRQDRAEILVRKEDLTRIPSLNLMRIFILVTNTPCMVLQAAYGFALGLLDVSHVEWNDTGADAQAEARLVRLFWQNRKRYAQDGDVSKEEAR